MMNPNDASLARMLQGMGGEELQGLGLQGAPTGGDEAVEPQLNPAMMEMLMAAQQNPDIGAKIHQLLQQMNQGANSAAQGAMGAVKKGADYVGREYDQWIKGSGLPTTSDKGTITDLKTRRQTGGQDEVGKGVVKQKKR